VRLSRVHAAFLQRLLDQPFYGWVWVQKKNQARLSGFLQKGLNPWIILSWSEVRVTTMTKVGLFVSTLKRAQ